MTHLSSRSTHQSEQELDQMHAVYQEGGKECLMAPHVVYAERSCPHSGCDERLQGIDFRLEMHGQAIHDPLVLAQYCSAQKLLRGSTLEIE